MEESIEQKFGIVITRVIDRKTNKMNITMKTMGEGIPLAEALIIIESWVKKVKEEISKPYVEKLKLI